MDIVQRLRVEPPRYGGITNDLRDVAAVEIERLRAAIAAIQQATLDGKVCDDVAWFSGIETLHDYCDRVLNYTADQAQLVWEGPI